MGLGKATLRMTKLADQDWELPELPTWIVMGRSNVGKSSLLNSLIHPQEIFRSGATPGVTRGLVGAAVQMGRKEFFLLDLPGWGYAVKSGIEQKSWEILGEKLVDSVLHDRTQIIWLVDPRRKFDEQEAKILSWLGPLNWFLVFTKADQVKRGERAKVERDWNQAVTGSTEKIIWASSKSGEGMEDLIKRARGFARKVFEDEEK